MDLSKNTKIARGKPAEFGQEIIKRRYRLTKNRVSLNNKLILDFGCGNGAQTVEFFHESCKIIAVDIAFSEVKVLSQYIQYNCINNIIPIIFDGFHLPLSSNSIDIILSYEVLEHVEDESLVLKELYRVLKSKGEMILSVPNKGWIFETHGAYLPLLPWNRIPFFSWLPKRIHKKFAKARIYRKRDIKILLLQHGFEIVNLQYITAPMDVINNLFLKKFLRSTIFRGDNTLFTFLATSILVHARKSL